MGKHEIVFDKSVNKKKSLSIDIKCHLKIHASNESNHFLPFFNPLLEDLFSHDITMIKLKHLGNSSKIMTRKYFTS